MNYGRIQSNSDSGGCAFESRRAGAAPAGTYATPAYSQIPLTYASAYALSFASVSKHIRSVGLVKNPPSNIRTRICVVSYRKVKHFQSAAANTDFTLYVPLDCLAKSRTLIHGVITIAPHLESVCRRVSKRIEVYCDCKINFSSTTFEISLRK